ncbi:PAP2 family protein [Saccharicrinis aurantiacus]|uniref:PAP2 family protein n=1 Tax=Saccharicrinis aurantiacus TaxID=1849719 RepID=UPI001115178A|nr:PAP2 family protein [Saccharicrinis aurantiacus]
MHHNNSILIKLAKIISTLFHPLLMPTLGLLVIFSLNSHITYIPFEYRKYITLVIFVSTFVLPLSIMPLFYQLGVIKSIQMEKPKERIIPLITTSFFFALGYLFLTRFQLPSFIASFYSGTLTAVVCALLITLFWKISIHMVGVGGVVGALLAISLKYGVNTLVMLTFCVFVAGLIGTARLKLNAHNPKQVYAGFALGLFSLLVASFV